jgi:hypothetical protein
MREGGTSVNQGGGQTPRSVADSINRDGRVSVTDKEVISIMKWADEKGVLKYVKGSGHCAAHYIIPDKATASNYDATDFNESSLSDD